MLRIDCGRDQNGHLYAKIAGDTPGDENLVRMIVNGMRDQDFIEDALTRADTDHTDALAEVLDMKELRFPVGTKARTKVAMYVAAHLNALHEVLRHRE